MGEECRLIYQISLSFKVVAWYVPRHREKVLIIWVLSLPRPRVLPT